LTGLMLVKEDMEVLQKASDKEGRRPGGGSLGSGWTRVERLGETGPPEEGGISGLSPPIIRAGDL